MTDLSPTRELQQALRDELIAVRFSAGFDGPRALARRLGLDPDKGHVDFWRHETGRTDWPDDPDARVRAYAEAARMDPLDVWRNIARRWAESLASPEGVSAADRVSPPTSPAAD
jgi:hypothetical protein